MSVIAPGSHVTLHYRLVARLEGAEREVASTFGARPVTVQLGLGHFAPPLEQLLLGLIEGASHDFEFESDEAYGRRHAELVQSLSRPLFDAQRDATEPVQPGDVVEVNMPAGGRVAGVVKSYDDARVVIDFNHPLAGVPLHWTVQVVGVL